MLVIDENLPASQRRLLRKWRIHFRAVGVEIAAPGTQDEMNLALKPNAWASWRELAPKVCAFGAKASPICNT